MSRQATSPLARGVPTVTAVLTAIALVHLAQPAIAQLRQHSEPGRLAERQIPARETLRERMASAPWQVGRWRLQPRLSVGDLVYNNNVFDENDVSNQTSDVHGSLAAGIDAYAPVANDVVFATFARPNYSWWQEREELRRLNWSYGAAVFGLFNRLSTGLSVKRNETERPINNELRIRAAIRQDVFAFDGSVKIRGPWQLFGSIGLTESRYPNASALAEQAPSLEFLARDEEVLSVGLAYDVPERFNAGVGWRRVDSEFVVDPEMRSNSGQYPFVTLALPGNKIQLEASVGLRQLEFRSTSGLADTDEAIGTLRTSVDLGRRTSFAVFSSRDIVYSAVDAGGFFASEASGAALTWGEGGSLTIGLFAQTGEDAFESADDINPGRIDDGESYGLRLGVPLRWGLVLKLGISETTIDSNYDEFDRSFTAVSSSVKLDLPDLPF